MNIVKYNRQISVQRETYNPRFNCNFPPSIDQIIKNQEEHYFSLLEISFDPIHPCKTSTLDVRIAKWQPYKTFRWCEGARFPRCENSCRGSSPSSMVLDASKIRRVGDNERSRSDRWRAIVNPRNERPRSPFNKEQFRKRLAIYAICLVNCKPAAFEPRAPQCVSYSVLLRFISEDCEYLRIDCEWNCDRPDIATGRVEFKQLAECQVSWKN